MLDCGSPIAGPPPVFIGGTGRSGTTIIARLLAEHSRYALIEQEVRFHSSPRFLPALLAGRLSLEEFTERFRGHWAATDETRKGRLHKLRPRTEVEPLLERFSQSFERMPVAASRRLVRDLLDPLAEREGKPSWVEMSPGNVQAAPTLMTLFPAGKVIHALRDGRDVACSRMEKRERASEEVSSWINHWEGLLRQAYHGSRAVPPDQLLEIRLEDLVQRDRDATFRRLLEFLEAPEEPTIRSYFKREMRPKNAHIGRWRTDLSEDEQERAQSSYEKSLAALRRDGVRLPLEGLIEQAA